MPMQDLFVGGVAIALGVLSIAMAILNSEAPFQLSMPRMMERQLGRGPARLLFGTLGLVLIVVGGAVIAGFEPGWLGIPAVERP